MDTMTPELLQKIEQLVAAGGVVLGQPPQRSPSLKNYPQADEQVKSLSKKMWGDTPTKIRGYLTGARYGKGLVLWDVPLNDVFALLNVTPDFLIDDKTAILYNHRTVDGKEIYFVSNQSDKQVEIRPQFRVKGFPPELWNPVTGEIRLLPSFDINKETTTIPMKLEAFESAFVVFRNKGYGDYASAGYGGAMNYPNPTARIPASEVWAVRFESDAIKRGTPETVIFKELQDWTKSDDDRIKYFSGTAVYETKIAADNISRNKKWYLDLGKVGVMAKVKINGQYAGGVWTAPYRVDATPFLKQGENKVEVEVVNTWVNRIIGDLNLPNDQRKVRPNYNSWKPNSPLQPSGLLGPVELLGY
jgi:hypothetical protein